ncbi:MAG: hypothetical protein Q4F71_04715 [Paracoccus sp. (in: a-proteobacteria)]|nr:hypothetical protein [Paracoccus sp. (in: a-proteobacteria)]
MKHFRPPFVNETNAARFLDMKPAEFRCLVSEGHIHDGKEIAPGVKRWQTDQLAKIASGDAIEQVMEW